MALIESTLAVISTMMLNVKNVSATFVPVWMTSPSYSKVNFSVNVQQRFKKNELIFACINKTANSASQVVLKVKSSRTNKFLTRHPLQKLIERPNRFMQETDLWKTIIVLWKLAGRAVLEKERNRAGQVIGLWPLRPDWLEIVPDPVELVAGFNFGMPGSDKKVFIPYRDVVDLPLIDAVWPIVPFTPDAPASIAARTADVDNQITDYIKLFFEKGGVPPGLLKTKQKLIESQVEIIRRRWAARYGGFSNWVEPAILDSDAEYQKIGSTFEEMGFAFLDRRNESRICMIMDIPPAIVGAFVGIEKLNYDNYMTARQAWWEDSLLPMYESILDRLTLSLLPEFSGDNYLEWDLSRVHALQQKQVSIHSMALSDLRGGGITVNEYRQDIGKDPIGIGGDVFLRPLSNYEAPLKGEIMNPNDIGDDGGEGTEELALLKAQNPPNNELRMKLERKLKKRMEKTLTEQFGRIKKELIETYGTGE